MTDITLEQRAALDSLREALPPPPRPGAHETITIGSTHLLTIHAALVELEAALRLSAGAEVSRLLAAWYEQGIRQGMRVQSPGHAHERPGIWDDDNGKLAGVECAACALWKIAAQIATAPRHEPGEG